MQRVKTIVDNLRDFSRVDASEWHPANLEKGLESTLNIVWNEIKYKAEVIKDYAGLPDVECIAAQINQVFMNLLVNAAHAIDERGTITLRTGFDDNEVWVEVEDTGCGIKPETSNASSSLSSPQSPSAKARASGYRWPTASSSGIMGISMSGARSARAPRSV